MKAIKFNWRKVWNPVYLYHYVAFKLYAWRIKRKIAEWDAVNKQIGRMTPMRYSDRDDRLEVYNPVFDVWEPHSAVK